MKKILLISNYVFHYRQRVYNYFSERFLSDGYEFYVAAPEFQKADIPLKFKSCVIELNYRKFIEKLKELEPDVVILFLRLQDKIMPGLVWYCNRHNIPVIFWNKGVSDRDSDNPVKNFIYHRIHDHCDALITYTADMKKNFQPKNYDKLFIGWNTVNCSDIDKTQYDKEKLKTKYGIKEKTVILYISRIRPTKKPEVLLETIAGLEDVAVVMMGAGMTDNIQKLIDSRSNLYYMGQKYGDEGNEIWAMGDIFSIPENCGLGINEAIFWNLPIVTMNGIQPPEIYYLKEGKTGFIMNSVERYRNTLLRLAKDDDLIRNMQIECQKVYNEEVDIKCMYQGFIEAVQYSQGIE